MAKLIFILLLLGGCANPLNPQPSKANTQNIYLQKWINTSNITYCEHVKEYGKVSDTMIPVIDGYFCLETLTKNKYYIPTKEWDAHNLDVYFLHTSKHSLRKFLDKNKILKDYLCVNNTNIDCSNGKIYDSLEAIQPWREK